MAQRVIAFPLRTKGLNPGGADLPRARGIGIYGR